jgi:hypothetical protein
VGAALTDPTLRETHRRRLDILNRLLETKLAALRSIGAIDPDLDPKAEADALVALSDGLGLGHLLRPNRYPAAKQRAIVEAYLRDRLKAVARVGSGRKAGR